MTHEVAWIGDETIQPSYKGEYPFRAWPNQDNKYSPCLCYQNLLEMCDSDVIVYMHTDLIIHDEFWWPKVHSLLEMPDAVAAGLGGATILGTKDLYRKPYRINQMARSGYISNQDDAEVHGERFDGSSQVAVLDAFFMAINVKWLKSRGGWPTKHLTHHCMDTWLACEATRCKKKIYMEGCSCLHKGGAMSVGEAYAKAAWLQGESTNNDHEIPHYWLYNIYRDVLPIII